MSSKPVSVPQSGEPQGILVDNGGTYRFVAVKFGVFPLDGRAFASVAEAEEAIASVLAGEEGEADPLSDGMVA